MEAVETPLSTARGPHHIRPSPPLLPPLPTSLPTSSTKRCRLPRLKTAIAPPNLLATCRDGKPKKKTTLAAGGGVNAHGKDQLQPPYSAGRSTARKASPDGGQPPAAWPKRTTSDVRRVSIGKRDRKAEPNEIAPNSASSTRGRQFAVSNVGNNGRIYLRPSVRPAQQRNPQPSFTFPVTPPGTSDVETLDHDKLPALPGVTGHHDAQYIPTPPRTSTTLAASVETHNSGNPVKDMTARRRAISDSTIHEVLSQVDSETDAFRLTLPELTVGDVERPKTTTDQSLLNDAPMLDINIPTWRLGTPRFTVRGTPLIRGSSYAPSEDLEDPNEVSLWNKARGNRTGALPNVGPNNRLSNLGIPQACFPRASQTHSLRLLRPERASYASTHLVIEADMFTNLTFKPACDEKTIVRYSHTGTVTAATASRLVAEITSPSFLDYELLSDFFLTFRSFLEPELLLQMLIARLRWALARMDETGMIVRVRAFVAIRHWILNYFIDDFVLDYSLRVTFCTLLNNFVDEMSQDAKARKVQLKILGELKKCWRRICAHYWDGPDFAHNLGVEAPIAPGGVLGNRDPTLDPTTSAAHAAEPRLDDLPPLATPRLNIEASGTGNPDGAAAPAPWDSSLGASALGVSHSSIACYDPSSVLKAPLRKPSIDVIRKPKTPVGKRGHLRNDSMSDPRRESEPELPSPDVDLVSMLQGAGRLVRGDLLPPGQPFVAVEPEVPVRAPNRHTTIVRPQRRSSSNEQMPAGATSGYGVKKLFNSVRRVLNVHNPGPSNTHHSNNEGLPANTLTLQATGSSNPQSNHRRQNVRQPMRIDLLGAEIAEDFKKAVREDEAEAEAERLGLPVPPRSAPAHPGPQDYSLAYMDSSIFDCLSEGQKQRPASDMAVALGNKMMSPVDGTFLFENTRLRRGAPPPLSTEKFSAALLMPKGGAPTPPLSPLTQAPTASAPRRPSRSFLDLKKHEGPPHSLSQVTAPCFQTSQREASGGNACSSRISLVPPPARPHCPPPLSGGLLRMQKRNGASNAQQSNARQPSSFASRLGRRFFSQNLDSARSSALLDDFFEAHETAPRFTIRRRPGGDLRAVSNVEDLDIPILRTSRSAATLTTCTESIRSSYRLGSVPSTNPRIKIAADGDMLTETESIYSLQQPKEKPIRPRLSIIETPSTIPAMPPCFEDAAKKLAALTDDEDDGGIESALLKLEGRYRPRGKMSSRKRESVAVKVDDSAPVEINFAAIFSDNTEAEDDTETRHMQPHERALWLLEGGGKRTTVSAGGIDRLDRPVQPVRGVQSFFSEASQDSDPESDPDSDFDSGSGSPKLDGSFADDKPSKRATTVWTDRSVLQISNDDDSDVEDNGEDLNSATKARYGSRLFAKDTSISAANTSGQLTVATRAEGCSFLDDESDAGSILFSNKLEDGNGQGLTDEVVGLLTLPSQITETDPPHPFGDPVAVSRSHSPAAPMTMAQALEMGPERGPRPDQGLASKPLPMTPTFPSIEPFLHPPSSSYYGSPPASGVPSPSEKRKAENFRKFSVHLPFILAFDSDILAQQFTLIEKDALSDIDWKDLIEMNWKDSTTIDSRSWVDFLRNSKAFGVEVVIARFNLMVKWAISEIVITQHPEERARCIVKFIHVAAHCRNYRNFATLAQLAIALTSTEISRLTKTWELVPERDMKTLKELETLVTPTRNFYNLRAEMETGTDSGCIPFVGIYTHDLLFNAQRPSEVASSPTTAPLINFERYRIVASVVKTLLRLLEASTRYTFQPVEGITERCLWMSALSDDEIRRHSEGLE